MALHVTLCTIFAWLTATAQCQRLELRQDWKFAVPLRVCTASIQDFGARCNGAPWPSLDANPQPLGPVPPGGWCAGTHDFCGYDISVWREVAELIGLDEGEDYEHVCMGEHGFGVMLDSLAGKTNASFAPCDIGVSAITATLERESMGITFSRATHRGSLAIMVNAPLKSKGYWAFLNPLSMDVWLALGVTIAVVPFFVFFFESIFSGRCAYTDKKGHISFLFGIKEALWHSISHTLSIDVFRVHTLPARIITVCYAFIVLILTNTYTANLAAFLTVKSLDTSIQGPSDLIGKAVVSITPYLARLYDNHRITAVDREGWDYDAMTSKLLDGQYAAVISDDTQLIPRAWSDTSCKLHVLEQRIEPFDLAFAFRVGFPHRVLKSKINSALLYLLETGELADIRAKFNPPQPKCADSVEFSETSQVHLDTLWGLWIILGFGCFMAVVAAFIEYAFRARAKDPEQREALQERAQTYSRALSSFVSRTRSSDLPRSSHWRKSQTLFAAGAFSSRSQRRESSAQRIGLETTSQVRSSLNHSSMNHISPREASGKDAKSSPMNSDVDAVTGHGSSPIAAGPSPPFAHSHSRRHTSQGQPAVCAYDGSAGHASVGDASSSDASIAEPGSSSGHHRSGHHGSAFDGEGGQHSRHPQDGVRKRGNGKSARSSGKPATKRWHIGKFRSRLRGIRSQDGRRSHAAAPRGLPFDSIAEVQSTGDVESRASGQPLD